MLKHLGNIAIKFLVEKEIAGDIIIDDRTDYLEGLDYKVKMTESMRRRKACMKLCKLIKFTQ